MVNVEGWLATERLDVRDVCREEGGLWSWIISSLTLPLLVIPHTS